jgi:hypothetical protein
MGMPDWVVKKVEPREDYTLLLTFADGKVKEFDARPLLEIPLYAPLKDKSFFMKAKVDGPSVAWRADIDIAPEYLYEKSKNNHF